LLEQKQAVQQWDKLLQGLSPKEQVLTLQAINLSILLFPTRKGIAALITQYMLKLFELGDQQPEAKTAHLVLLALRARPQKLQSPLQFYLGTQPQPGMPWLKSNFRCASIQSILQNQILCSFLEEALKQNLKCSCWQS